MTKLSVYEARKLETQLAAWEEGELEPVTGVPAVYLREGASPSLTDAHTSPDGEGASGEVDDDSLTAGEREVVRRAGLVERLRVRRTQRGIPKTCPIVGCTISRDRGSARFPQRVRGIWMSRLAATLLAADMSAEELEHTANYLRATGEEQA